MSRLACHAILSIAIAVFAVGTGAPAAISTAACPQVTASPYGFGCAPFFDVPVLKAGVDPSACTLTFSLSGISGCCNTYLWNRILILGASPAQIAVPPFVSGCMLLASPDVLLVFPASAGNTFTSPIPALALTVYVQGVNDYFTTFGFTHDYNWSNGLKIDIQ